MLSEQKALVTFPRSGSFFLSQLIKNNSSIDLVKTHVADTGYGTIITIARNPEDTIVSFLAMLMEYRDDLDIQNTLESLAYDYTENYTYFDRHANIVIGFDQMIVDPEKTIKSLLSRLEADIPENIDLSFEYVDMVDKQHLASSTSSEYYEQAREACSLINLDKANELYNSVLSKACNV